MAEDNDSSLVDSRSGCEWTDEKCLEAYWGKTAGTCDEIRRWAQYQCQGNAPCEQKTLKDFHECLSTVACQVANWWWASGAFTEECGEYGDDVANVIWPMWEGFGELGKAAFGWLLDDIELLVSGSFAPVPVGDKIWPSYRAKFNAAVGALETVWAKAWARPLGVSRARTFGAEQTALPPPPYAFSLPASVVDAAAMASNIAEAKPQDRAALIRSFAALRATLESPGARQPKKGYIEPDRMLTAIQALHRFCLLDNGVGGWSQPGGLPWSDNDGKTFRVRTEAGARPPLVGSPVMAEAQRCEPFDESGFFMACELRPIYEGDWGKWPAGNSDAISSATWLTTSKWNAKLISVRRALMFLTPAIVGYVAAERRAAEAQRITPVQPLIQPLEFERVSAEQMQQAPTQPSTPAVVYVGSALAIALGAAAVWAARR